MHKHLTFILLFIAVVGCKSSELDIPHFDEIVWQEDSDGCAGKRSKMRDQLIKSKVHLKGLNGDQVTELLGKPNNINLADRNQKYFTYNITCPSEEKESSTLSIRFNAVGLSYEVIVY